MLGAQRISTSTSDFTMYSGRVSRFLRTNCEVPALLGCRPRPPRLCVRLLGMTALFAFPNIFGNPFFGSRCWTAPWSPTVQFLGMRPSRTFSGGNTRSSRIAFEGLKITRVSRRKL